MPVGYIIAPLATCQCICQGSFDRKLPSSSELPGCNNLQCFWLVLPHFRTFESIEEDLIKINLMDAFRERHHGDSASKILEWMRLLGTD